MVRDNWCKTNNMRIKPFNNGNKNRREGGSRSKGKNNNNQNSTRDVNGTSW